MKGVAGMKKVGWIAAAASALLVFFGCADAAVLQSGSSAAPEGFLHEAGSLPDGNLNLVVSMDEDVVKRLVELFSEQTGCSVSYAVMSAAEAERIFLEQKGNAKADVYLGGTARLHEKLKRERVTQRYLSVWRRQHEAQYLDDDGYWSPISLEIYAIGVNTQAFAAKFPNEPLPKTLQELTDSKFRGHLLLPDPDTSFGGDSWCASVLQAYGKEEGPQILERLLQNRGAFTQNDLTAAQEVGLGSYPLMVGRLSDQIRMKNAGLEIEPAVYPEAGWTITPVSLLAECSHLREGRAFIDFMLTRETGNRIGQQSGCFSTREDVAPPQEYSHRLSDYPVSKTGWAYQNDSVCEDIRALLSKIAA